jgi:hypothetical protein
MPALPTSAHAPAAHRSRTDWPLLWVLISVSSILIFQVLIVIAFIRWANVHSKARWRRLRQRGVVILDGPALIWTNPIPPAPAISTFNLRQTFQTSDEQVAQYYTVASTSPNGEVVNTGVASLVEQLPAVSPGSKQR